MFLEKKPLWVQLLFGAGIFALVSSITYLVTLIPPIPADLPEPEGLRPVWSVLTGIAAAFGIVGPYVEVRVSTKMKVRMTLIGYLLVMAILVGVELMAFRYPDIHFAGGATGYKIFVVLAGLAAFAYTTEHLVRDIMQLMPQESSRAGKAARVLGHKVHPKGSGPQRLSVLRRRDHKTVGTGGPQIFSSQPRRW